MPQHFASLAAFLGHGHDALIDVRSPSEFAEDHVPGALSLPVLDDGERARVGTIYTQDSPFAARKLGAALLARNAARHIEGPLAAMAGGWRPLVYCWRGGQRSGAFASILQQIGWRAETVAGGYKSWRKLVSEALYEGRLAHKLILLDGNTGTGKTALLGELAALGHQVIDLEGLAGHRGSLLGATEAGQPAQKGFETALAAALAGLDPARVVLAEAESSKIGQINLPPALWKAMVAAPRITIAAPLEARAAYLAEAYADLTRAPARFAERLRPLVALRGHEAVEHWLALLDAGDLRALAQSLMVSHYDSAYAKSRAAHPHAELGTVTAQRLDAAGRAKAAGKIAALVEAQAQVPN